MRQQSGLVRVVGIVFLLGVLAGVVAAEPPAGEWRWYKGNTHTHTWWSDGDAPPEMAALWYKEHGYNFLVISDHNIIAEGTRWVRCDTGARSRTLAAYEKAFGPHWVEKEVRKGEKEADNGTFCRLKTLAEFRTLVDEPGRFMLIPGEEISNAAEKKPVHLNGLNLRELIPAQQAETVLESLQKSVDAVLAQQAKYGIPMLVHVNHPNFGWALTPEDLIKLEGERFFEVFNGHPSVHNEGDATRPSTDRMWDILQTKRLAEMGKPGMFGLATDDAHNYAEFGLGKANPGRGWVMVRARFLTPNHILQALNDGDFYSTTGVMLKQIQFADNTLSIEIDARPGVNYRTQFIGTLQGYDPRPQTQPQSEPLAQYANPRYSDDIGKVLSEVVGSSASYTMTGKEIYVRAKVFSDAPVESLYAAGDTQTAWVQPVQPTAR